MKLLKEKVIKESDFGTRTLLINDIIRTFNKFPGSRDLIADAFEKVAKKPWDDSMTSGENLMQLGTEDIRYIHQEVTPLFNGGKEMSVKKFPPEGTLIDFNFSVKTTEKGYDIYSEGRQATVGSSLQGVKEWITNWIENELN